MTIELRDVKVFQAGKQPPNPYTIQHGFEEMELLLAGGVFYGEGKKLYGRGAMFWHSAGDQTIYDSNPEAPYRCITFVFDMNHHEICEKPKISQWKRLEDLNGFVDEMLTSFCGASADSEAFANYVYQRLAWQTDGQKGLQNNVPPALQKLILDIEQSPHLHWNVENMAEHCQTSTSLIHHWFKSHLNKTPHQLVIERRLSHARYLLTTTHLTVDQVARACGYPHSETFFRSFKRYNHVSPKVYRQKSTAPQFKVLQ